jgi:hypothetical protein
MRRLFGLLALAAAALALWVLFAGPPVDPFGGARRVLPDDTSPNSASAVGMLTGLALGWLAATDWSGLAAWLRLQRRRLGLLVLGALLASLGLLLLY